MRVFACFMASAVVMLASGRDGAIAQELAPEGSERMVLVELYTSQGCDMCPEAERLLGLLAERNPRVVPVAFHVDYFNDPWKDPFADALHSKRQMAYNALYTKPKNPEYGLYYTPMLMIDGEQSVSGRDPAAADDAIRRALAKTSQVALEAKLKLEDDARSGEVRIKVSAHSSDVAGRELLVCAVLRDDRIVTKVRSGENANKTLTNRFPARLMKYEFTRLDGKSQATLTFPFKLEPSWKPDRLSVVTFVQDKQTGVIYQSAIISWKPPERGKAG